MTFIAVVSKSLSARGLATDEDITDAIMVAQMLPGPVAVDMTVAIGYRLRGLAGAAVCWLGSVMPSFIVVTSFERAIPALRQAAGDHAHLHGVSIRDGRDRRRRCLRDGPQAGEELGTGCAVRMRRARDLAAGCVLPGRLVGDARRRHRLWLRRLAHAARPARNAAARSPAATAARAERKTLSLNPLAAAVLPVASGALIWKIFTTFAVMSVVLFGSGYVFIPIIKSRLVHDLHWLTADEFTAGLALTQITPGPILMTAAFVGVKIAGLGGAVAGMLGMFVPPAILTLIAAHLLQAIKKSAGITAALKGIRPAVVGMIFAAAVVVGESMPHDSVWHAVASALILGRRAVRDPAIARRGRIHHPARGPRRFLPLPPVVPHTKGAQSSEDLHDRDATIWFESLPADAESAAGDRRPPSTAHPDSHGAARRRLRRPLGPRHVREIRRRCVPPGRGESGRVGRRRARPQDDRRAQRSSRCLRRDGRDL